MQMAGVLFLLCWHFHFQNIMQKKPVAYSKHVHLVSKISRLSNADKGKSLLIGVFSRDLFSFTSGVTEHFSTVPVKGREWKLILVAFVFSCVDTVYRVVLQVFGISNSKFSVIQKIPLYVIFLVSICCRVYLLTNHFRNLSSRASFYL